MNLLELIGPLAYLFAIVIGLVVVVFWIFAPIIVVNRLNTLIEIGQKILAAQIRAEKSSSDIPPNRPIQTEPIRADDGTATCQCFHCGQNISFEKSNYDPNNAVINCPGCGKKTKIFVPTLSPPRGI